MNWKCNNSSVFWNNLFNSFINNDGQILPSDFSTSMEKLQRVKINWIPFLYIILYLNIGFMQNLVSRVGTWFIRLPRKYRFSSSSIFPCIWYVRLLLYPVFDLSLSAVVTTFDEKDLLDLLRLRFLIVRVSHSLLISLR